MAITPETVSFLTLGLMPTTPSEGLRTLAHAAYLKIFTTQSAKPSLLVGQAAGETLFDDLIASAIRVGCAAIGKDFKLREAAKNLEVSLGSSSPEYHPSDMAWIYGRVEKDADTASLLYWMSVAYSSRLLPCSEKVPVYLVRFDGSLYRGPDVDKIHTPENAALPPFMRWLYAVSDHYRDATCPINALFGDIVTRVALPMSPLCMSAVAYGDQTTLMPLPNIVNAMLSISVLCSSGPTGDTDILRDISMRRFFSGGSFVFASAVDLGLLSDWVGFITKDGQNLSSAFARTFVYAVNSPEDAPESLAAIPKDELERVTVAQESMSIGATEDDDEDDGPEPSGSEDPITEDGAPDGTEIEDTGADVDNGMMGDTHPDSQDGDDSADAEDPNNPIGEGEEGDKDTIGLITIDQSDASLDQTLFRNAVVALSASLDANPSVPVTQAVKNALKEWCQSWLWILGIDETRAFLSKMGLRNSLREFDSVAGKIG